MEIFLFACLLLASLVSALPLNDNQHSRYQDDFASFFNVTSSPFLKIRRTSDVTVRDAIYSSPAVVFIGTKDKLVRCLYENPNECEIFYNTGSIVYSLLIVEEYVYAGLNSNIILRCNIHQKESCKNFQTSESTPMSLASAGGYLYVGLMNGKIMQCQLHEPYNCRPFHELEGPVFSLIHFNDYIYAGVSDGLLMRCSWRIENSCAQWFNMNSSIYGFSNAENSINALTSNDLLWNCSPKSDDSRDYCVSVPLNYQRLTNVASFNGVLYMLNDEGIYSCKRENSFSCSNFANIKDAWSMAFMYGAHEMQNRFKNEDVTCVWQSNHMCPPTVIYYDARQRALLQVNVKNGKLYNSFGLLVDTTNADEGRSGSAAVFVMAPDGKILLSNRHMRGLIHSSSLFAGRPVSGAGFIVVKDGVIEKITTCSDHYQPDLNLNQQVIESLRAQGYSDAITLQQCDEDYEPSQTESNEALPLQIEEKQENFDSSTY